MTIALVSNSRAELGPLAAVAAALPDSPIVRFDSTGMSPNVAVSQAVNFFTVALKHAGATRVVCLGDRYEMLAAGLAATFLGIPVAHIHGGEQTLGAFDDPMRHCLTQIADLHFVAHELFAKRVFAMKGHGGGIHIVGAPGLDGVPQASATRSRRLIMATYHPETRAADHGMAGLTAMLDALWPLVDDHTYELIFTGVNNDPGRDAIFDAQYNYGRGVINADITHAEYIAYMQTAALVIGNSSAGIIEAPWIGCPSVNIGDRQKGRPLAASVFQWNVGDEKPLAEVIADAIAFNGYANPFYTGGNVGEKIAKILKDRKS